MQRPLQTLALCQAPQSSLDELTPATAPKESPRGPPVLVEAPGPPRMRAVQITRFGGPEVLDVVDLPDPVPAEGQVLYEVSSAGGEFGSRMCSPVRKSGYIP